MAGSALAYWFGLPRPDTFPLVSASADRRSFSTGQIVLLCAALAFVFQLLLYFRGFYSSTLDETGRTLDAYMWVTGRGSFVAVWLPLYRVIMGAAVWLTHDLLLTPRIVTGLFGIGTIVAVVFLAEELFRDRTATLLAGIISAILPERVILSAAPLAEILFAFFVVTAMLWLVRYRRTVNRRYLFLAGVFFALSAAVRYEGWVFSFLLVAGCALSELRDRTLNRKTLFLVAFTVGVFPVCWILLNIMAYGDPLAFFTATADRYVRIHGARPDSLLHNNVAVQFFLLNLMTGNILGVLVLCSYRSLTPLARPVLFVTGMALLILALQMLLANGSPTHGFWRIAALWSILLVPFTGRVISAGLAHRHFMVRHSTLVALIAILSLCLSETYRRTESSALSSDEVAAGQFLQQRLSTRTDQTVLIESVIWSYTNVMVSSQTPERFLLNSGFDPLAHEPPYLRADVPLTPYSLSSKRIAYLVFRTDEYIEFFSGTPLVKPVARFGPWHVFEVL